MAMNWENLGKENLPRGTWTVETWRARVPGGWLVLCIITSTKISTRMKFVPDPAHEWDGNSVPDAGMEHST